MNRSVSYSVLFLFLFSLFYAQAHAQSLRGTVKDLNGVIKLKISGQGKAKLVTIKNLKKHTTRSIGMKSLNPLRPPFKVSISTQPKAQFCKITSSIDNIKSVKITCEDMTLSGKINNLKGTLILKSQSGEVLTKKASGSFSLKGPQTGSNYKVYIVSSPTNQTCTIANGSGRMVNTKVTNIAITCDTKTFSIGGSIQGLTEGGLTLLNNGTDRIFIQPGVNTFTFPKKVAYDSAYMMSIEHQPNSKQVCNITNGQAKSRIRANVNDIVISCSNAYAKLFVNVNGLVANQTGDEPRDSLYIQNNNDPQTNREIVQDGITQVALLTPGAQYNISVIASPQNQDCSVTGPAEGTITEDLNDVTVNIQCITYNATLAVSESSIQLMQDEPITITISSNQNSTEEASNIHATIANPSILLVDNTCTSYLKAGETCTMTFQAAENAQNGTSTIKIEGDNFKSISIPTQIGISTEVPTNP